MNVFFVDDTAQGKRKHVGEQYVGIGGVIIHDDCIRSLFDFFREAKHRHGIPPDEEIKWSPDRYSWIAKNLLNYKRVAAYSDILDLVRVFQGTQIVAVIRRDEPSHNAYEARWECLKFITERFQFFLQTQQDRNGIILADYPGSGKQEKRLLGDYRRLLEQGTGYVKPHNIVMNLLTTESHLNPALQIADLVVGITTAMCSPAKAHARPYWSAVKRSLHRNPDGRVMGCGLKFYPSDKAAGLHRELFPEESIPDDLEGQYQEHREEMRYLYSQVLDEEELDLYFP